jgi:hypothetical protein
MTWLDERIANSKEGTTAGLGGCQLVFGGISTLSHKGIHKLTIFVIQAHQVLLDKGFIHWKGTTTQDFIHKSTHSCSSALLKKNK